MGNRKHQIAVGEHYHCFNRGVEKRNIFCDQQDYVYFLKSLRAYNTEETMGKLRLYENKASKNPPVTILSYCLLPNHYHLLLRSNLNNGVAKYLQRVSGGYTLYFNNKYNRSGSLFQGTYKSTHIETDQDLRQLLAYVNFNFKIHNLTDPSLYRHSLNTSDALVRGLTSNLENCQKKL
jgi:REP element-mobilizing transposase RayT